MPLSPCCQNANLGNRVPKCIITSCNASNVTATDRHRTLDSILALSIVFASSCSRPSTYAIENILGYVSIPKDVT
eukprot:scaffold2927_cov408-Prasinococcus_capsulatus_cf.AAC.1